MELSCGARTYEWQGDWAKLPAAVRLGYTHGVAEDSAGNIYIANASEHAIAVFDSQGNYLRSWGARYAPGAHGLTYALEDGIEVLYLANTGLGEVVKTTLTGDVLWRIGTPPRADIYGGQHKFSPTETAIGPGGRLYVTDGYGQHWVHQYTTDGEYRGSFGGAGAAPGKLREPHGITIDARDGSPKVQVANRANRRIDDFTLDGDFIQTAIGPENLRYPCTSVIAGEELYIPDLFCRLSVFDRNNKLIGHLGDYVQGAAVDDMKQLQDGRFAGLEGYPNIAHANRRSGKFSSPHGLHVSARGDIYVVEWINDGRITRLQRSR